MPDERALVYWDANIFLAYIGGDARHLPVLDAILDDSSNPKGRAQVVTSTVSIVEVAFATYEKQRGILDPRVEDQINDLWADEQAVKLAEFHEMIAREARTLIRRALAHGMSLKPLDAIHLATAEHLRVAEFHTYDQRLFGYAGIVGFSIGEPAISQPKLFEEP